MTSMKSRSERPYVLVIAASESGPPGCLDAVTDSAHFAYDAAANARDAIEIAERRRPSVILLNLHDYPSNSLEICRTLVAAEATRDVPILAITGPADQQFMIALAVKPCDVESLDREIRRIIDTVH
jgi:CheY-like chemotaxis protein